MDNTELIQRLFNFDGEEGVDTSTGHVSVSGELSLEDGLKQFIQLYEESESILSSKGIREVITVEGNNIIISQQYGFDLDKTGSAFATLLLQHPQTQVIFRCPRYGISITGTNKDISMIVSRLSFEDYDQYSYDTKISLTISGKSPLILRNHISPLPPIKIFYYPETVSTLSNIRIKFDTISTFACIIELAAIQTEKYKYKENQSVNVTGFSCDPGLYNYKEFGKYDNYNMGDLQINRHHDFGNYKYYPSNDWYGMECIKPMDITLNKSNIRQLLLYKIHDIASIKGLSGVRTVNVRRYDKRGSGTAGTETYANKTNGVRKEIIKNNVTPEYTNPENIILE